MQSFKLCDDLWQIVVCWLSVVFRRRRYCQLLFTLLLCQYTKTYTQIQVQSWTLCTTHMCMEMFAVIKLLFSHWHIILRVQKPPMDALPTFSLMKVNLCKRTIGLRPYPGAYVNRELIVQQELHCALYSDSYLSFPVAYYQAHWNYSGRLINFRIFFRLNRIWVFNWLYSTVATVTKMYLHLSEYWCNKQSLYSLTVATSNFLSYYYYPVTLKHFLINSHWPKISK